MDCCAGDTPINFGTWYCPYGKTPEECTYCEYCVKNKCINISHLRKLEQTLQHCTCDCPKKHLHEKLFCYLCPKCEVERMGKQPPPPDGKCKQCKFPVPFSTQVYCASCSIQFKSCYECGIPIKEGNAYITDIEYVISKYIKEIKELMEKDKKGKYHKHHTKTIEMFTHKLHKSKELFANKNPEQMCSILMELQRKRFSKLPNKK